MLQLGMGKGMRGVGGIEIGRLVGVAFFLKQTISQIAKVVDQKKMCIFYLAKKVNLNICMARGRKGLSHQNEVNV